MKRRSQKQPPRDREMEQVKSMTHLSITQREMRERLLADKNALENRLKELFKNRKTAGDDAFVYAEPIALISEALRNVKAKLR